MTPHVCLCVCTSPRRCTPDEQTLLIRHRAFENIWQHLKQLLKVSNQTCRRGAFVVSETAHPSYMLIGPDQPFPYKGLMFVKSCVSVQLVQLRSPDGLKIVLLGRCFSWCFQTVQVKFRWSVAALFFPNSPLRDVYDVKLVVLLSRSCFFSRITSNISSLSVLVCNLET